MFLPERIGEPLRAPFPIEYLGGHNVILYPKTGYCPRKFTRDFSLFLYIFNLTPLIPVSHQEFYPNPSPP